MAESNRGGSQGSDKGLASASKETRQRVSDEGVQARRKRGSNNKSSNGSQGGSTNSNGRDSNERGNKRGNSRNS
jgi:hypothetical protein